MENLSLNNNLGNIKEIDIRKEMMNSYIDYAMSVIVGRALPDVRDGLKPVHRRILYSMHELNLTPEKLRKCVPLGEFHQQHCQDSSQILRRA